MYRLLLLVFLCNSVSCHWHTERGFRSWKHNHHRFHHYHGHGFGRNSVENSFEKLANQIIKGDDAYLNYCTNNANNVQEIYGEDSYELIYSVPGFTSGDIKVQVKHRVIYTTAETDNNNVNPFSDIRVLSDILNAQEARWILEDEKIKVIIPYKINFKQIIPKQCGAINREIVTIPKQPEISPDMFRQSQDGHQVRNFSPNNLQNVL